jgi:UDP-N-acetylglucosamine 2-epimerase (non-hydrolysing)
MYGDVKSTLAATLACYSIGIPISHIEAGLRSFDMNMQEEKNRILVDHLSHLLFTSEKAANENLKREGILMDKVFFSGNCMIQ